MYQDLNYEMILYRMLSRVPDDIDTREGSIIMNALAPAAMEVFLCYLELDRVIDESYADSQSRDFLIRRAKERGLEPWMASPAIWQAKIKGENLLGTRFSNGDLSFIVSDMYGIDIYALTCEQAGTVGNFASGSLIPLETNESLEKAELLWLIVPGRDEEDTESFRTRYFESISAPSFGGNVADYREKTLSVPGISELKVVPNWDGGGTVKLVILAEGNTAPSEAFVGVIQNIFDPIYGQGRGLAPIGHKCTAEAVEEVLVDISTEITGENIENLLDKIYEAIDGYFSKLIDSWATSEKIIVRISQLEAAILEVEGIEDIANTSLNLANENLELEYNQIPVRGDFDAQAE